MVEVDIEISLDILFGCWKFCLGRWLHFRIRIFFFGCSFG
jgi:hypothetical protein